MQQQLPQPQQRTSTATAAAAGAATSLAGAAPVSDQESSSAAAVAAPPALSVDLSDGSTALLRVSRLVGAHMSSLISAFRSLGLQVPLVY